MSETNGMKQFFLIVSIEFIDYFQSGKPIINTTFRLRIEACDSIYRKTNREQKLSFRNRSEGLSRNNISTEM